LKFLQEEQELATQSLSLTTSLAVERLEPSGQWMGDWVDVSWLTLTGATQFRVYREYEGQELSLLNTLANLYSEGVEERMMVKVEDQEECSTATYWVQPIGAGLPEQQKVATDPVTAPANDSMAFIAEGLRVTTEATGEVNLVWRNLPCVQEYTVLFQAKDKAKDNELQEKVSVERGEEEVSLSTNSLPTCTDYSIKIIPSFMGGRLWEAEAEVQETISGKSNCRKISPSPKRRVSRRRSSGGSRPTALWTISIVVYFAVLNYC